MELVCFGWLHFTVSSNSSTADVKCNEVCVFCHETYSIASKFIRHAKYCHVNDRGTKAPYMQQVSNELRKDVVSQLHRAKRACIKKRKFEGPELPQAQRVKIAETGLTAAHNDEEHMEQSALQPASGTAAVPATTFDDFIALERRNRTPLSQTEVSAPTSINIQDTSYPNIGITPTQLGRYDPVITRIANWPASWDQILEDFSGVSGTVL